MRKRSMLAFGMCGLLPRDLVARATTVPRPYHRRHGERSLVTYRWTVCQVFLPWTNSGFVPTGPVAVGSEGQFIWRGLSISRPHPLQIS